MLVKSDDLVIVGDNIIGRNEESSTIYIPVKVFIKKP